MLQPCRTFGSKLLTLCYQSLSGATTIQSIRPFPAARGCSALLHTKVCAGSKSSKLQVGAATHKWKDVKNQGSQCYFATKTRPVQRKTTGLGVDVQEALLKVRSAATASFDESVDVAVQLNIDTRKSDQNVRGSVELPHGTGKTVKVAVFAKGDKVDEALSAGADVVGAEDLVEKIKDGFLDFDRCIATPDMMGQVAQVARILGPKGLMPNPKLGTITADVEGAVASAKRGQAMYRAERKGIVHACIGKVSFSDEQLLDNLKALQLALLDARPKSSPKGVYFKTFHLSSTMGTGVPVAVDYINPQSRYFLLPKVSI